MSDEAVVVTESVAPVSAPVSAPVATPIEAPLTEEQFDAARTDELQVVWDKLHPARDPETQRFALKDGTKGEQSTDEQPKDEQPAAEQATPAEPPKVAVEPPTSWTADAKAKWAQVPAELQSYLSQRDKESHTAITQAGQKVKQYETYVKAFAPFSQVIESYKDVFARRGMQPVQAFAVLLNAQKTLDDNPVAGLTQIGRSYGIDLGPAFQGFQVQAAPTQQSPEEVIQLREQFQQLKDVVVRREQTERAAEDQNILGTIDSFQTEKDKDGKLLHPHFAEAKPMMAVLLANKQAQELKDAYDIAVHAMPTLRQRILADQRKTEEAQRTAAAKAKSEDARKSNSVNVKSAASSGTSHKTMDDTLREIAIKNYGRAS